tara:strand:- start:40 stop:363 length:324 start_codon:yes stop_codon:yes gene_type:complete
MAFKMTGSTHYGKDPLKQKISKNQQKIVGEQTGMIMNDDKNQKYVLQEIDTDYGVMKGDTIQLSGDGLSTNLRGVNYLLDGDYYGKQTKKSLKRKKGPKTFNIKSEE